MKLLPLILILFLIPFISAGLDISFADNPDTTDRDSPFGVALDSDVPTDIINYSLLNVSYANMSAWWNTSDYGPITSVSILNTYLNHSLLNELAWSVAGHTIDTNIDMDDNNLYWIDKAYFDASSFISSDDTNHLDIHADYIDLHGNLSTINEIRLSTDGDGSTTDDVHGELTFGSGGRHTYLYYNGSDFIIEPDDLSGGDMVVLGDVRADNFIGYINASYLEDEIWVNITGDTMTGQLNIEDDLNVTQNITAGESFVSDSWCNATTCYTLADFSNEGYAQYQFTTNNFNGSGNFNTTSAGNFGSLSTRTWGKDIANGGFDSGADWTTGTGWSIAGGVATWISSTDANLTSSFQPIVGKIYMVTYTITDITGEEQIQVYLGGDSPTDCLYGAGLGTITATCFFRPINADYFKFVGIDGPGPPFGYPTIDDVSLVEWGGLDTIPDVEGIFVEEALRIADGGKGIYGENAEQRMGTNSTTSSLGATRKVSANDGKITEYYTSTIFSDTPSLVTYAGHQSGVTSSSLIFDINSDGDDTATWLVDSFRIFDGSNPSFQVGTSTSDNLQFSYTTATSISSITHNGAEYLEIDPGTHLHTEQDIEIHADGKGMYFGQPSTDLIIGSDGTNPFYNSTGVHTFYNGTGAGGLGTIRYAVALTSTTVNNDTEALESFNLGSELYNANGSINHTAFGSCYVQVEDTDYNNCSQVYDHTLYCLNYTSNEGVINECQKYELENNISDYTAEQIQTYNIVFYEEEITRKECGTKLTDTIDLTCEQAQQRQALALLNKNINLLPDYTEFGVGLIAEEYITNTTKDIDTMTKLANFRTTLSTKTFQQVQDFVLTPEGKLSNNVLMNSELSDYGSYDLAAVGHFNRAINVLTLWENTQQNNEIDGIKDCIINGDDMATIKSCVAGI